MTNCFYTYAYLRKDGTPYYIGKGKGYRAWSTNHKPVEKPSHDRIMLLKTNLTEQEAFKHEIYMIAVFGRKDKGTGILRNKSDGGGKSRAGGIGNFREGTKHKEETKKLIGSYHKGKNVSEETKEKLRKANKGKKWWNNGIECKHAFDCPGLEWKLGRIRIGKSRAGGIKKFKHKEETKKLIGSYHKGKNVSEETKEKLRKENKGKKCWNNGQICKRCEECPGPEWTRGMIKKLIGGDQIGYVR